MKNPFKKPTGAAKSNASNTASKFKQTKPKMTNARKKQLTVALIGLTGLAVVVVGSIQYVESGKKEREAEEMVSQKEQIQQTDFSKPKDFVSEDELWKGTEGARVEELEGKLAQLENQLKTQQGLTPNGEIPNQVGPDGLGSPANGGIVGLNGQGSLPPPPPEGALPNGQAAQPQVERRIRSMDIVRDASSNINPNGNEIAQGVTVNEKDGNNYVAQVQRPNMSIDVTTGHNSKNGGSNADSARFRALDSYIPSGTFFRSVLLGGVDAPTGGDAQNANPHPVLLRVTDFANLPNRFKYNFRECFLTGTAYGDLSSERAYIRTQNLSCVGTDGRAIDMPVKGYVAGEDGKTGVRGAVVSKQGQMLANALLAAVVSGVGKGISESTKVTTDSVFGQSTSIRGSDQYKAGVGEGIGNAADRLAQYYIKLADKVFPVIEVNAGRTVDVVLLEGISIDSSK